MFPQWPMVYCLFRLWAMDIKVGRALMFCLFVCLFVFYLEYAFFPFIIIFICSRNYSESNAKALS